MHFAKPNDAKLFVQDVVNDIKSFKACAAQSIVANGNISFAASKTCTVPARKAGPDALGLNSDQRLPCVRVGIAGDIPMMFTAVPVLASGPNR